MAEHSMCQPGRPLPQGLSQEGSPGLAFFQSAKSAGERLRSTVSPPSPCMLADVAMAELAVFGILGDVEVNVSFGLVGVALLNQASSSGR